MYEPGFPQQRRGVIVDQRGPRNLRADIDKLVEFIESKPLFESEYNYAVAEKRMSEIIGLAGCPIDFGLVAGYCVGFNFESQFIMLIQQGTE